MKKLLCDDYLKIHLNEPNQRLYEIDWLRSLAFILLFLYHIGMFYVSDWGWHVKSAYQSTTLQYIMLVINPWRMPLIFFISGFTLALLEYKISSLQLIKLRFLRVFVPLVFASNIVILPQPYFEAVQNHDYTGGFWNFAYEYFNYNTQLLPQMHHSSIGLFTWNHLWYLAYLWFYTLVFIFIRPILKLAISQLEAKQLAPLSCFLTLAFALTLIEVFLEPIFPRTHGLFDDWYNHSRYFLLLIVGYSVAKLPYLYTSIISYHRMWLLIILPMILISLVIKKAPFIEISTVYEKLIATSILVSGALCCLFAVVSLSGKFLNKPSSLLSYLNNAVLPWYILHQTVIIIVAMQLAQLKLGGAVEAALLILITFIVCAVLYETIKRFNVSRFLFGMKLESSKAKH